MASTSTRIILVRHGRTALNAEGRLRGLANPELDPTGVEQALNTAFALRPEGIASVLSSLLNRAVSTAAIIAKISEVDHRAEPALNDRDYGEWTGHIKAEVIEQWGSVDAAPGVEPTDGVRDRALVCLDRIARVSADRGWSRGHHRRRERRRSPSSPTTRSSDRFSRRSVPASTCRSKPPRGRRSSPTAEGGRSSQSTTPPDLTVRSDWCRPLRLPYLVV